MFVEIENSRLMLDVCRSLAIILFFLAVSRNTESVIMCKGS